MRCSGVLKFRQVLAKIDESYRNVTITTPVREATSNLLIVALTNSWRIFC